MLRCLWKKLMTTTFNTEQSHETQTRVGHTIYCIVALTYNWNRTPLFRIDKCSNSVFWCLGNAAVGKNCNCLLTTDVLMADGCGWRDNR